MSPNDAYAKKNLSKITRRQFLYFSAAAGGSLPLLVACKLSLLSPASTPTSTPTTRPTSTVTPAPTATSTPKPTEAPTPTPPPSPAPPTEIAKKTWTYQDMTVAFLQTGPECCWRAANTASFKETADELGITLKFYEAENKLSNQISAFREFITDPEVNVIILAAIQSTGYDEVLEEAKAAGKLVVIEDLRINAPEDLYATYVGPDFVEEGRKAAIELCALLKDSAKKNVVELAGNVRSSAAKERGQGFREKMGECGITITQSESANWEIAEGQQVMNAILQKDKDIQGVFAQNDYMALGAIQAIKETGLKPGKDIKIVSIDGYHEAFEAMIAGDLNVTIECNPLLAPQAYEAALKALNGETLPKWIRGQESVFRAEDAATVLPTRKY